MAEIEDPQLARVLAETVSELRVLRQQLATAAEGLPIARRPEPHAAQVENPAPNEPAAPLQPLPEMAHAVTSRLNPTRFGPEAVAKPHRPLAPRSPSGGGTESRAYSWEMNVKSSPPPPRH